MERLRTLLAVYPQEHRPDIPPFQGGVGGFLAYDMNRTWERLPLWDDSWPSPARSIFHAYDVAISFDHRYARCWIVSIGVAGIRRVGRA